MVPRLPEVPAHRRRGLAYTLDLPAGYCTAAASAIRQRRTDAPAHPPTGRRTGAATPSSAATMAQLQEVTDPLVGRTVRAATPLRAGQLVIQERPLIAVGGMYAVDDRALRRLYRAGAAQLGCGLISFLNLHAFVHASKAVQDRILDRFCSYEVRVPLGTLPWHEPPERRSELPKLVRLAMRVSEWCCENIPCCASIAPDVLARAQCCFALNSFSLSDWLPSDPALLAEHALFEQGSRLTHSCGSSANTVYHCVNGLGEHRATRDIAAGEIITTSYLTDRGGLGGAMAATAERQQHLLEGYLFRCACARCAGGPDLNRRFPCCAACGVSENSGEQFSLRHPESGLLPLPSMAAKLEWTASGGEKTVRRSLRGGCGGVSACTKSTMSWAEGVCQRAATVYPSGAMAGYSTLDLATADQSSEEQVHDTPKHEPALEIELWRCDRCNGVRRRCEIDVSIHVPAEMLCYWLDNDTFARPGCARSLFDWEQALITKANAAPEATTESRSVDTGCSENAVAKMFGTVDELVSLLELCLRVLGPEHWVTATVRERALDALLEAFEDDSDGEDGNRIGIPATTFGPDLLLSTIAAIQVQFVELWCWFDRHGVCSAWNGVVEELLLACQRCPDMLLAQPRTAVAAQGRPNHMWLGRLSLEEVVSVTMKRTELEYGTGSEEATKLKQLAGDLHLLIDVSS